MVHFTFKNGLAGKSLSVHNSFKSFIIMVVMLVLTTSSAFAEEIDGLNYKLDSETKTAILIPKTNGKYAGDIVVPGKIKGTDGAEYSVVTLGAECFSACYNLSSITIPSTVTVIGVRCFKECGSLTSVVIPSSVSSLGEGCFKNCSSLTSINIPSSVTSLGYECFYGCSSLVSIIIPSSVTSLDWSCFWDCKSLTSITIPPSVTSLSKACFYGCSSLTSITIPASVTSIGSLCFAYCSSLTSITIPASVKWIGEYRTFTNCVKLNTIFFKGVPPTCDYSSMGLSNYIEIKVPAEYLQDSKKTFGSDFINISAWNPNESGDDDKPVTPCATPAIFYGAGKLKFSSETAGAKYHYTISDKDMATDALCEDGNVSLSAAYDISVYATADGYSASEKAKATLYWVNANLENTTNIYQARTRGVVASAHDGIVCISGLDNGEVVKFYAADGKLIGSSSAVDGTASCAVSETMVIAKFGDNAIKVAVK